MTKEKKKKRFKTSKAMFKAFKKEALRWIEILELSDWDIDILHEDDTEDALATATIDINDRICVVRLGIDWGEEKPTERLVKGKASHEIRHIFLAPVTMLAHDRYAGKDALEEAEHALLHKLGMLLEGM